MPEFNPESRRDRRCTIAIYKGAGLVDETRQLMNYWRPGEEEKAFVQRVQEEDLLGRYTAYRARDIARRVFARWFLILSDRPAPMIKGIVDLGLPHKTFAEMLFLFACRADDLLHDFTIQSYWEAVRRGRKRRRHHQCSPFASPVPPSSVGKGHAGLLGTTGAVENTNGLTWLLPFGPSVCARSAGVTVPLPLPTGWRHSMSQPHQVLIAGEGASEVNCLWENRVYEHYH